ncbi:hypothetical protein Vau01_036240 [Virgisporangium aurantiacum]|uniref:Excalibur calcium-binding domain-containing protein n=1 Tax=Virgisporangium aurantiacum TaxID=175570 RepID=A0A8J3Z749_9ACTN|nr:hypothetical protein Vau01_036240 [Virgisporangium aurantiacum]
MWITLPIVAAFLICGGIGAALSDDEEKSTGSSQAVAATPPPAPPQTSSPPSPSSAENPTAYLTELRTIGPDLIRGNENRAVDWGRRLCDDIRGGLPAGQHATRAAQRYSGGNVQVTQLQGARLVAAAVKHMCPDAAPLVTTATSAPTAQRPADPPPQTTAAPADPPADVYYRNCDEVRAAGKAPLRRGQPGYRSGLDRDGDGFACDK